MCMQYFLFYVICLVNSMVAQPQAGTEYDLPAFVDEIYMAKYLKRINTSSLCACNLFYLLIVFIYVHGIFFYM